MFTLTGQYNTATVYTDTLEQSAQSQIVQLLNQEFISGSRVRIMPDAHAGAGCVIGTTMTLNGKVVPNLVGVDIGCGMETAILRDVTVDLHKLDKTIHAEIPSGFSVRKTAHVWANEVDLSELICAKHVNLERAEHSIGTLGGGNHFIELDRDDDGKLYLVIHSGSRNLGKQIAEHYQKLAASAHPELYRGLAYLDGGLFDDYLHDMSIAQNYADLNRRAIVRDICKAMKLKTDEQFATIHNYIDLETLILRKGAIRADAGERVLIPMNMRDGSLLCVGKGNAEWNNSAPHGAGRLMSRSAAKEAVTLHEFKAAMDGIYSTTVSRGTIDEAPQAYKPMSEIVKFIGDTVHVVQTIRPLYNFKAGGD